MLGYILMDLLIKKSRLIKMIYDFASSLRWREKITEDCGIDNEDIDFIIKRLERTGFISKITGTYFDYAGGEIKITKSFLRFMEYIKTDSSVS